jgi:hypothetical protein
MGKRPRCHTVLPAKFGHELWYLLERHCPLMSYSSHGPRFCQYVNQVSAPSSGIVAASQLAMLGVFKNALKATT